MSKILIGLLLGTVLGLVDGASAWFYEDVRQKVDAVGAGYIIQVIFGSAAKGLVAGLVGGWLAAKKNSLAWGVGAGTIVGCILSALVVVMGKMEGDVSGDHPFAIVLPGMAVGAIAGYAAMRYGRPGGRVAAA